MRIIKEETKYFRFAFDFSFSNSVIEYCRSIRESYGWQEFTWSDGRWRFNDRSIISLLKSRFPPLEIEPEVKAEMEKWDKKLQEEKAVETRALELKNTFESNLEIPNMKADLRSYQKVGVEFFINNKGRCILADEMGSGKTLQSLAYVVKQDFKKTLVVAPASVKFSWENEVSKWTHLRPFIVNSQTDFDDIGINVDVVIINYDILKKHLKKLMAIKWDCLIADEAHLLKNKDTIRSKCVKLMSKQIPHIIMLTGTPLLSRPIELYNILNTLDSENWNNYFSFAINYCDGKRGRYGFEAKGATNLDELRKKISRYFLRRTKDQILTELPPKTKIEIPIQLSGEYKVAYEKVQKEFIRFLKENKGQKDKEILRTLAGEKLVKLNYLRGINSMGKLDTVRELINSIVEAGQKVLVFSVFNEPLQKLHEEYDDSVMILGSTDVEDRGAMVKKFQENPDCKVFFGGIRSAGVGITLTAASNVIFIDHSWNPADMLQAEDRVHRMGQKASSVNIYQVISKGTIDEFMKKLLERKQVIFDVVIDSEKVERSSENALDELIAMIEENNG